MTTLLPALVAVLALAVPAAAELACGTTVARGEKVTLTGPVGPCDDVTAAVVVDGGSLDLGGFSITCADGDGDGELPHGVMLLGKGAKLANGTITDCANGVAFGGRGRHRVANVTVQFSLDDGFDVLPEADRNRLQDVVALYNGDDGIQVRSDRNRARNATALGNGQDGIDLWTSAERNKVVGVATDRNGAAGVLVDGRRNTVVDAVATENVVGIHLDGVRNRVRGGTAQGNGAYDLAACAGDKVRKLVFTTATPDCS